MPYSNIFGLTAPDIVKSIKGSTLTDFNSATGTNDGTTLIQYELDRAVSYVKGKIPERYRKMLSKIEGEILTDDAYQNQSTFTLKISNASTVKLYKNYFSPWRNDGNDSEYESDPYYRDYPKRWSDRNVDDEMESTEYTVNGQLITLSSGLSVNDTLYAEYTHTLVTPPKILVWLTLEIARYWCIRKYLVAFADDIKDGVVQSYNDAVKVLDDMNIGKIGIEEFDDVELVEDTDRGTDAVRIGIINEG